MAEPLVSIVIPCYNAARFVRDAIESALAQTYPRVEVIVIDDGSTDDSVSVLRSFGERIRFETGPNRGGGAARNRGVELARGELIQFLDADDLLHAEKLSKQVPQVVVNRDALVFCDGEEVELETGERFEVVSRPLRGRDPVIYMLEGGLQTPAPIHWKEAFLAAGGFRTHLPCSQERDLHLRMAGRGVRFHHLPEILYTVRTVPGSVSSDSLKILDQHGEIAWSAYREIVDRGQLTDARARAFAGFLAHDARHYLRHGEADRAASYFEQARQMHPAGGIDVAYRSASRWLYRLLGARLTERLTVWKRSLA